MKKLFVITMVLILIVTMSACGKNDSPPAKELGNGGLIETIEIETLEIETLEIETRMI